jgi:hypothetical protein
MLDILLYWYTDANWISDSHDIKSTSGFVFIFGGAAISWQSTKQTVIAKSTMEAELIALDSTCTEAEWLKELLSDIPLVSSPVPPISIHCDSKAAIDFCKKKLVNSKLNRHIKRRQKSVRQQNNRQIISLNFVKSEHNVADCLTKGLNRTKVLESSRGMGLYLA